MKIKLIILAGLSFTLAAAAADKADFTSAEKFAPENLRKMVGSREVKPHWIGNNNFWYSYKTSQGTKYFLVAAEKGDKTELFRHQQLAAQLAKALKTGVNSKNLDLEKIDLKKDLSSFTFEYNKNRFIYHRNRHQLELIKKNIKKTDDTSWQSVSPDKKWFVFARDHNLYLARTEDPKNSEVQLTGDGEKWFSYAKDDGLDQPGKRVGSIAVWFPDSSKIFLRRSDKRKVRDLFLIHSLARPRPTLETYKYALPGEKDVPQYELAVLDLTTKKRIRISGEKWPDQYLGFDYNQGIYPGKDSTQLYFIRVSREFDKIDLCRADTGTGMVDTVLSEESVPYFDVYNHQFHLTEKGDEFIWWSERHGRGHLYLYSSSGRLKNRITRGEITVGGISAVDEKKRQLFFLGYGGQPGTDPYYKMYYRVSFNGSGLVNLTPENASHSFTMSKSKSFFIDTFSRVDAEPISVLRNSAGKKVLILEKMDIKRLLQTGWQKPRVFTVKAADGITDLYGVMWKPFKFDHNKKYPVISYVYPGPQAEPVPKTFFLVRDQRVSNIPLAQLGFVVITVGQRGGSPLRSKWYHNFGYSDARDYPLADNKFAIEQLAEQFKFIDISRVGIYGRSGGGFMSAAAMLVYPEFYKVAVSSCGNHDNNIYDYEWGEMHYKINITSKTSPGPGIPTNTEIARNLKGRLLLIHGEIDNNVHPANTFRLVNQLIKYGKRFDLMVFPGKRHSYGNYTRYIERMMWYYFAEHLLGDYRKNIEIYQHN